MSTYQALISGLFFGAGALAACRFTALHYQSRLNEARASANLFKDWWERDSGKMLVAQAELDLIAEQRRSAGRKSHQAEKALFVDTALWLAEQPAQPLRPRVEIEAEVAARRAARINETLPVAANPAPGNPADLSAGRITGRSGATSPDRLTGRGRGSPPTQEVAPQRQIGRQSCPTNRAAQSAPAETPTTMKGL